MRKTWDEFRNTGLLWLINTILHAFGWTIIVVKENHHIIDVYPARVKFRGFTEEANTKNYKKISQYMKDNAEELWIETVVEK